MMGQGCSSSVRLKLQSGPPGMMWPGGLAHFGHCSGAFCSVGIKEGPQHGSC